MHPVEALCSYAGSSVGMGYLRLALRCNAAISVLIGPPQEALIMLELSLSATPPSVAYLRN